MNEGLAVWDFRSFTMMTVKDDSKANSPTPMQKQSQECNNSMWLDMLTAKVTVWLDYRREQQAWEPHARSANRTPEADTNEVLDEFSSAWYPAAMHTEDAVTPFVCEAIATWAENESLSKENIYTVVIVRLSDVPHQHYALRLTSDSAITRMHGVPS